MSTTLRNYLDRLDTTQAPGCGIHKAGLTRDGELICVRCGTPLQNS